MWDGRFDKSVNGGSMWGGNASEESLFRAAPEKLVPECLILR